jgi:hypothetical protein
MSPHKLGVGKFVHALTLPAASCTMNRYGRLAQRLERSVYTRKVVRSNRTVPTIVPIRPTWPVRSLLETTGVRSRPQWMPFDDSLTLTYNDPLVGRDILEGFRGALRPAYGEVHLGE